MTLSIAERYTKNLKALAAFQPEVARAVEATVIPEGVVEATGRDGSRTFQIPADGGRLAWFGQSSMPTISADELFAGFRGDGRNVCLPGVLTGMESIVIASRIPAHSAVFVVEPDPLPVRLALHLRDYTSLIQTGRLIFLLGTHDRLIDSARAFFNHHPGYEFPVHLLPVPQRSASQIADLQNQLERAGHAAGEVQSKIIQSATGRLSERTFSLLSESPRAAVLSTDPNPASLEQARRVERAIRTMGWPCATCIPSAPDQCHLTARINAVETIEADLILLINTPPAAMRNVLPGKTPLASWYLPDATVRASAAECLQESDAIFVASPTLRDQLIEVGVPADRIESCDMGADSEQFRPVTIPEEDRRSLSVDAALLMDLPDDRPQSCDVHLPSHVALWKSLQSIVRQEGDQYQKEKTGTYLDRAQYDSGTALKDAGVRAHFIELLKTRIAPAVAARTTAETLTSKGIRVGLWGVRWPTDQARFGEHHGPIPCGEALNRLFNAAGVIVLPDPSPQMIQIWLDALAASARVVCRRGDVALESACPALRNLVPHLHTYQSLSELLDAIRNLTTQSTDQAAAANEAARLVKSEHTVAHRIRSIVQTLPTRRPIGVTA